MRFFSRRMLVVAALLALVAAGATFGARTVYENEHFITTENASVQGMLVRVSSPNTGRVFNYLAEIGTLVQKNDAIAVIDIPISASLPAGGGNRSTFLDARDRLADVTSPVTGVIVSRSANAGDMVAPNQTLITLVDTTSLWVVANIEETKVARIQAGQSVEIFVDTLGRTVMGTVESIVPATTSTFALLPPQNASGNFTKVVQLVPVRIAVPHHEGMVVGASARVRIHLD